MFALLALCSCIGLSAFFSASETSLFSLSSPQLRSLKESKDPRHLLISSLLHKPRELLVSILMLNICVNILTQNLSSDFFSPSSSWALRVGLPTALTLFFGEIIPKSIAMNHSLGVAYRISPIIHALYRYTHILRCSLSFITEHLSRFLFFFLKKEKKISLEELEHMLSSSQKRGLLHSMETQLIRASFSLQSKRVKELMRPRGDIVYYSCKEPLDKLLNCFSSSHSKIPVCYDALDQIAGFLSAKDFFLHQEKIQTTEDILALCERPYFIPENTSALSLVKQLHKGHESLAMVVDEYGTVSGLITESDILSLLLGQDEDKTKHKHFTKTDQNSLVAKGKLDIHEFNTLFSTKLPNPSKLLTLGGWLTEQMGDIPQVGSSYRYKSFFFHILSANPKHIQRIYILRTQGGGK